MDLEEIQRLTVLDLDHKIDKSRKVIAEALYRYSAKEIYVAWTGGKDSTTMLWLFKEVANAVGRPMPRAMFIDEGSVFEEILDLVKHVKELWKVDVAVVANTDIMDKSHRLGDFIRVSDLNARNQREIARLGCRDQYFVFDPESFIGNHLMKTVAMNEFIEENRIRALTTAIRWDEQETRIKENYFSPRTEPGHMRVHPILHFTERDIWDCIQQHNIPFCTLYRQGYRSLGAKGSTMKDSDIPAWEQDLENTTERSGRGRDKEKIMGQLRDLGYM